MPKHKTLDFFTLASKIKYLHFCGLVLFAFRPEQLNNKQYNLPAEVSKLFLVQCEELAFNGVV